ncbi:Ig-like domain-containing protein [Halovenus rubra]|uniref:Ig-like domain-containing protein n=2 Tax=Halovenus rubra TaxID=869890 RepID=A0ACC7DWM3_9EURY|nr:Ig-like domain-containing protein [Halovenus rubra]
MRFLRDDRSQAIQIGAVLIFGILIVFLALYQGFVVPNQNEEIEFDHNQQLQSEMTDMRSTVISMPGQTTTQSVSLKLGVRYPSRALFVNPGPASGSLRTVETTNEAVNLTIENATVNGEVGDFWNGTARSYNTGAIEYRPNYNLFATAPQTIYEHSVLYNDFGEETTLPITGQALVSDDRITLVTLNGSLSESRIGDAAIDFEPVSTNTRTVEIFNESHPVTVSVPTLMNESQWEDVFTEELADGNVTAVNTTALPSVDEFSLLEITLEPGTYSLQIAKIGVGTGIEATRTAYLTDTAGNDTTIQKGQTQTLKLEVRDAYNNPVSGVTVNGSAEKGVFTSSDAATVTADTDENGQLTVEYEGINPGNNDINFTIAEGYGPVADTPHAAGTSRNVTMTVTVDPPMGSGGGNGSAAFNVSWLDPSAEPGTEDCDDNSCTLDSAEAQQLELTLNTSAQNAGVDFAVSNTSVGTLNTSSGTTDRNGEVTVTFQPQANGTVEVYGWTGGGGDQIEIEVTNAGLIYQNDAVTNDGDDSDTVAGGVNFSVANRLGESVTITDVNIAPSNSAITGLSDDGLPNGEPVTSEVYIAADLADAHVDYNGGTDLPENVSLDTDGFSNDGNAQLSADATATFYLYEFTDGTSSVDMSGEDVEITVTYQRASGGTETQTFTITPTDGSPQPGIVFAGKSNGRLSTIDSQGQIARSVYSVTGTTAAGPQTTDFAFGPGPEVPYKDGNGNLGIVDQNGNKQVLVDTNYGPGINDVRLAVGRVFVGSGNTVQTNGGPFVYFINGNGKLTRVDASGTTNIVTVGGTQVSAQAVAGTGDIDADGSPELVFVDSNSKFDYIDSRQSGNSGNFKATIADLSGSPTLNTPNAVGAPADFDGDSAAEIPYIDGSKRAKYVNGPDGNNAAGDTTTLTTATGGEYPVGVADVAGDSKPEVIYVDTSGNQRLAYAGRGSVSGFITDSSGNEVPSATNPGTS